MAAVELESASSPLAAHVDAPMADVSRPWSPECKQSFRAALLGVTPMVPFLGVIGVLAVYAAPPNVVVSLFDPFVAGTIFAVTVGLIWAVVRWRVIEDTSAERANSASFDEIRERLASVTARQSQAARRVDEDEGRQMALREVDACKAQIQDELNGAGPGWVLGDAYINVWQLIHRAEEALLEVLPTPQVIAEALYDEQRLAGSQVEDRDQLLTRLRLAVARLDGNSLAYLNQQPIAKPCNDAGAPPPDPSAHQTARSVLREIRRTINEFRDESWGAIVRTRNHLLRTLTMTGLVTYVGLLMALDLSPKTGDTNPRTDSIIAAAVFYLVGAMVGLFNRLSSESTAEDDLEDYGLTEARLGLTPVLSGLAAVGGVYLTAMLTHTLVGVVGSSTPATDLPSADHILNLTANPFGIVLAAIFGLSPTILISSLQAQADKYKGALQSTAPHS